jgi:16S rRNA processing protein RimM
MEDKKNYVFVGTFGQPHGLKGEIYINIQTSSLDSFKLLKKYFLDDYKLELIFKKFRKIGKKIVASIENCQNRDEASLYKGKHIYVLRKNFPFIENDSYYVVDLIDCLVVNIQNKKLGKVVDVKNYGAGDLIEVIDNSKKTFFIPMNKENLEKVNIEKKIITVNPISGLIE